MGINYLEACQMEDEEIMEANAALDIHLENQKKSKPKKKKKKKGGRK